MAVLIWLGYSHIRRGLHLELLHSFACSGNNKTITGRIVGHILSSPFSQLGFCPRISFAQSKDICGKRRCNFFLFWFVIMRRGRIRLYRKFTADRDWDQFHTPANLAKSISIEANELLECFQWSDTDYDLEEVKDEPADVIVYCIDMLDKLGLDADEIINRKMSKNEAKYPVEKAKGNSTKYNRY